MNTNRISMSALTPDLKDKLLNGKVLIPTALAAVGAFTFLSAMDVEEIKVNDTPVNIENEGSVEFKSNALFGTANNSVSFSDAFHAQREALGPGGVFEYKNKYYNTFLKEEWDIMTDDQKKDYYASIQKNIDNHSVVHNDIQGNITSVKIDVTIDEDSGDITVTSLTPNVNIESVTVNAGGSTPVDPTPVDPTPVDPTPDDPTPVDPTPVDQTPDDPTPVDPTPVDPTPDIPNDIDNIIDPSEIEMEDFDNVEEPSAETTQEDNIADPSEIEIDDIPDPSLSVTEETDNLLEPVAENTNQISVDNAVSLSDDITIDPADFDF